ncbi:hypothetical protein CQA49_03250 [Helicobacter sp. MIT 00-7814]|uniref:hypothetical protein n=1 Tax=unclassified Helicobacter TaxID=2593540 RepID=UPI000E1E7B97|nr:MULTISPECIES: hypothetical protein [unclassified Helicobacter]RDU55493.1 hypothetical protein CQA37_03670 [Helicobacter sp. MIT 99-10781]RDU55582.1 hypothetical protein CQA49_03250 [Helicobacter sp. MIT 00-7814]
MKTSRICTLLLCAQVAILQGAPLEKAKQICEGKDSKVLEQALEGQEYFVICTPIVDKADAKGQARARIYARSQLLAHLKQNDPKLESIRISQLQNDLTKDKNALISLLPKQNLTKIYAKETQKAQDKSGLDSKLDGLDSTQGTQDETQTIDTAKALQVLKDIEKDLDKNAPNSQNGASQNTAQTAPNIEQLQELAKMYFQLGDIESYNQMQDKILLYKFQ